MAKIKLGEEWTREQKAAAKATLLEPSPYEVDGGALIGRDPRSISVNEFHEAGIEGAAILAVLRAKCLDCVCHQPEEVRKCVSVTCPNWPYRMATNPFHKREISDERRAELAERARTDLRRPRAAPNDSNLPSANLTDDGPATHAPADSRDD
jgi:hypothetical protein